MAKVDVVEKITEIVTGIIEPLNVALVDIEYKREGRNMVLRLFLEKEAGITLDDCADVSRQLSDILDVEDFMPEHYTLEVSSPGICRPLKKVADYERFVGHLVKVKTFDIVLDDAGNKRKTFVGKLTGVENQAITMHLTEGQHATVPLDKVAKANLEFEF